MKHPLYDMLTEVFGPLTPNQHSYYSEIASEIFDTVRYKTPKGIEWWFTLTLDSDEEIGTFFVPDFWWAPPHFPKTQQGSSECEALESRCTTEVQARELLLLAQTKWTEFIEADHEGFVRRMAEWVAQKTS